MPEGDTVYRTAARLRDALVGRTLTRCDVRVPKFATVDLTGCVVDEVLSRGKHLFIRVGGQSGASIHSHLKMDGAWLIGGQTRRVPEFKVRIILETAETRAVGVDLGCSRYSIASMTWPPSSTSAPTCWARTGNHASPRRT
jgi:endonuclease VIII